MRAFSLTNEHGVLTSHAFMHAPATLLRSPSLRNRPSVCDLVLLLLVLLLARELVLTKHLNDRDRPYLLYLQASMKAIRKRYFGVSPRENVAGVFLHALHGTPGDVQIIRVRSSSFQLTVLEGCSSSSCAVFEDMS